MLFLQRLFTCLWASPPPLWVLTLIALPNPILPGYKSKKELLLLTNGNNVYYSVQKHTIANKSNKSKITTISLLTAKWMGLKVAVQTSKWPQLCFTLLSICFPMGHPEPQSPTKPQTYPWYSDILWGENYSLLYILNFGVISYSRRYTNILYTNNIKHKRMIKYVQ